jgi:hypothetical protein
LRRALLPDHGFSDPLDIRQWQSNPATIWYSMPGSSEKLYLRLLYQNSRSLGSKRHRWLGLLAEPTEGRTRPPVLIGTR